jgi:glucose dehydrogenase
MGYGADPTAPALQLDWPVYGGQGAQDHYSTLSQINRSHTGKLLWETELPFSGLATPATYMVNGKQYIVIAASGGQTSKKPSGGVYIAFALP